MSVLKPEITSTAFVFDYYVFISYNNSKVYIHHSVL